MKFLKIIIISLLILFALAYILFFTKPGNKILKPYIEKSIKKNSGVEISLTSFTLRLTTFKIAGKLASDSFVIDGKYNLFKAYGTGVYKLDIKDLAELTKRLNINMDIMGNYWGTGNFFGNKDNLTVNGKGKLSGIDVDYKIESTGGVPETLNIGIYNSDINKVLNIINRPDYYVFDSSFNADINYNLKTEKGNFTTNFENGHFVHNRLSGLILQFAQFDITKQVYKNALIKGNINKKIITANLNMKGPDIAIASKNAILDIQNNTIDAILNLKIKNKPLSVTVKGKTEKPKIKVDVSGYVKTEIKKHIDKLDTGNESINNFLKKMF
ncbi:MAG: hypothetical protein JRJ49_01090 [Deltaproteobacteria bacterium]|nr:hypothetical protein [Deltaproteobacteria bacterium]